MSALKDNPAGLELGDDYAVEFIRRLNGSAQSVLVRDRYDRLWVVKPHTLLQGPNALANEWLGSQLCRAVGLPVPDYKVMLLGPDFCQDRRVWSHTSQGVSPLKPGMHFASRFIPDATQRDAYEMIPPSMEPAVLWQRECLGMFIFDVWAMHADRRQTLMTVHGGSLIPTFFDHTHLFGGPYRNSTKPFIDGRFLQRSALKAYEQQQLVKDWITSLCNVLPTALQSAIRDVPEPWLAGKRDTIKSELLTRLEKLDSLLELAMLSLQLRLRDMRDREQAECRSDLRVLSHRGGTRWS